MKKFIYAFVLLLPFFSALSQENKQAEATVNKYLDAVNLIDFPEGKSIIREYSWDVSSVNFPQIISYTKIFSSTFDTDVSGIQGYKQYLNMKVTSKGGFSLNKKYMIICYKSAKLGNWKVFGFREAIDVELEVLGAKDRLTDTKYTKAQYNYRNYGYWLLMAGKPLEARKSFLKALELNGKNNSTSKDFSPHIHIANEILGM